MRIAVAWPKPRQHRWRLGQTAPTESPDYSDAFLYLEREGFEVTLEDSLSKPLNPLVDMHEFYSGLDPLRAARIVARARRYDAVLCVGDSTAFALMALRQLFGLRLPIVLMDPALSGGYAKRERLQKYLLPRVEHVVVYGRTQLDFLRAEYGSRVPASFLYHRADVDFYNPAAVPASSRTAADPFVFSIGNDASRDFGTLADAAALCVATPGFQHRFLVHTSTPFDDGRGVVDVRREKISYPRLRELYAQAGVVAVPLFDVRHAGGINSLLEAMAMARPIVVSASHGITDYVQHESTALVVPAGDAQAMADAIRRLIASPDEARRLGENARRFVVEHCENQLYARALAPIVRTAVAAAGRDQTR